MKRAARLAGVVLAASVVSITVRAAVSGDQSAGVPDPMDDRLMRDLLDPSIAPQYRIG